MFIFLVTVLFPALSLGETYRVEKVLDGDTVILDNVERVRLIGVDTTEKSHPFETV
jgi:endonuclease YncB( thermonuclease family)